MNTQQILWAAAVAAVPTLLFSILGFLLRISMKRTDDDIQGLKNELQNHGHTIAKAAEYDAAVKELKTLQSDFNRFDTRLSLVEQSNEDFKQYLDERFTRMEKGQEALYNQVNTKLDSFEKDIRELWKGQNGGHKQG